MEIITCDLKTFKITQSFRETISQRVIIHLPRRFFALCIILHEFRFLIPFLFSYIYHNFFSFTACVCSGDSDHGNWTYIADNIALPYDNILNYHPQFEGYQPGTQIKQADAILVGYPLQYRMSKSVKYVLIHTFK